MKRYLSLSSVLPFLTDMVRQGLELTDQPHVVVATPGRLADHIRSSNTVRMNKIQFLVSSGGSTGFQASSLPNLSYTYDLFGLWFSNCFCQVSL